MRLKNYLTSEQVKSRAKSPKEALIVSQEHWEQNVKLTRRQLNILIKRCRENFICKDFCGLCLYDGQGAKHCAHCPAFIGTACCDELWIKAFLALCHYQHSHSVKSFKIWGKAANAVYKFLMSLEIRE